ncbi:MAG: transpeptidase family protein [Brumimicrobium sp.]|nr:transpeptidase family protein [Brumimicrobium sp.]MCO5267836.1 transpeptidase family protein [Brumimicrobium sp.]
MKNNKAIILRTYLLYSLVVIAMIIVLTKTVIIIMDGRERVFTLANSNLEQRPAPIPARRGEILDNKLSPLVTSVSFYDIYMDPIAVKEDLWQEEIGDLCIGLAQLFPEKSAREYEEYLREARKKGRRYVLIHKRVTHETREKVRNLPIYNKGRYKGGLIDSGVITVRKRPNEELLARTIGYIKDNGKDSLYVGIEGTYNNYLAGQEGIRLEQRIGNSWKPTSNIVREAINGYDLVTSIDKDIQEVAHTELENQLKTKGGKYGCAVVMEVKTGFIKAMVNLQEVEEGVYKELYNHALGTREVPGSTMKLAALMAALEDGKVKLTDTVNAVGHYKFYDQTLTDSRSWGYGKITLKHAFEVSSNVISKVIYNAYKEDPQKYIDRLQQFGITEKSGINLNGEVEPLYSMPGTKEWWGGSLGWMAIGYEFRLTPLELLSFYNAVANNGKYMQPQLVTHVINNGGIVKEFKPIVKIDKIASQTTINTMKDALEGVVEYGTGSNLKSAFFNIAGKTGTAQIANNNEGYGEKGARKYLASFVGYFPADDPIYSCIISIAAPTNDIYGASVSGTVFSAIANKVYASSYKYHEAINEQSFRASTPFVQNGSRYDINTVLNHFRIKKDLQSKEEWIQTVSQENKILFADLNVTKGIVPNVVGMGITDAIYLLEKQGLVVKTTGYGRVINQSLVAGQETVPGELIHLLLK